MSQQVAPQKQGQKKSKAGPIIGVVVAVFVAIGLMAPKDDKAGAPAGTDQPQEAIETPGKVTRTQYGDKWPFTVEEGYIDCVEYKGVVFRTSQGVYALNGQAKSMRDSKGERLFKDDMEIRAIDEKQTKDLMAAGLPREKATVYIMMPDFIAHGLKMCEDK